MHLSVDSLVRYLVIKSAWFSVPKTFLNSRSSLSCLSCTHGELTLMCLSFPALFLFATAKAADESAYTTPLLY